MPPKRRNPKPVPVTEEHDSHPIATGLGSVSGAAAGAAAGAALGPIGMVIGCGVGAVAGGAAGQAVGEKIHPGGEEAYWRETLSQRPYFDSHLEFERDYLPALRLGWEARQENPDRPWDAQTAADLRSRWIATRGESGLEWERVRPVVRDAWERAGQTLDAHRQTDRYYAERFPSMDHVDPQFSFEDYRPAYRYGTYARANLGKQAWDDRLEAQLERGWASFRGDSRLDWRDARLAVRDAWESLERRVAGETRSAPG